MLTLILLVLLGGFVLFGLWFGFIHSLGALAGTILGAFAAGRMYEPLAAWGATRFGLDQNLLRVACFLILFVLINRLVGFLFYIVERMFKFLSVIPFLSTIDHLLGGLLGLIEGVFVLGLTVAVAAKVPVGPFAAAIQGSPVAVWLMKTAAFLLPLLPTTVRSVL